MSPKVEVILYDAFESPVEINISLGKDVCMQETAYYVKFFYKV